MVNIALLLGFTFSGAAIGFLFVRGGLMLALSQLVTRTESREVSPANPGRGADVSSIVTEWQGLETQSPNVEIASSSQGEDAPLITPPEQMERCPCGLMLPMDAMIEHRHSTGHVVGGFSTIVRSGKIWQLEQAVVEQTSPDCYKCGKPVKGLKRVGKTIYVSHVGCIGDPPKNGRTRRKRMNATEHPGPTMKEQTMPLSMDTKCPICWNRVVERGSVTSVSSTGIILRFHNQCLRSVAGQNLA